MKDKQDKHKSLWPVLWGITLAIVLVILALVVVHDGPARDTNEPELRFLDGFEWASMTETENYRFIQGVILGSTFTEAAVASRQWSSAMSLYNVSDVGLMRQVTEYYYYTENLAAPVIGVVFTVVHEARRGGR